MKTYAKRAKTALLLATLAQAAPAQADEISQAYRMHRRLAGVNPSKSLLESMTQALKQGRPVDAAMLAIDNDEQSYFYNITLKKFFNPWFDEEGNNAIPLNDATATLIGMTRDDKSFQQMFSSNLLYIGANFDAAVASKIRPPEPGNNLHYSQMEAQGVDLKKSLTAIRQTDVVMDPEQVFAGQDTVPAGVLTTRGWGSVYYQAGTNRAPVRFLLKNFLCQDIDAFHDTTVPDNEVRRDPDRAPGGESTVYNNKCKGCHAGMDPMSRAFSYLDYNDTTKRVVFTKPKPETPFDQVKCATNPEITLTATSTYEEKLRCAVVTKYMNNKDSYPAGYVVTNDHWKNFWTGGNNARVGWPAKKGEVIEGDGPKALGLMFAQTKAFPRCMAQQVMQHVCLATDFESQVVKDKVARLAENFVVNNYNMKKLFAETAVMCMGQ
jgi:hypothetical protein